MLNASLDSLSFSSVPSNKFLRVNELGIPTISDIKSCPLLPAYYGETYIRGKWRLKLLPNMYFNERVLDLWIYYLISGAVAQRTNFGAELRDYCSCLCERSRDHMKRIVLRINDSNF